MKRTHDLSWRAVHLAVASLLVIVVGPNATSDSHDPLVPNPSLVPVGATLRVDAAQGRENDARRAVTTTAVGRSHPIGGGRTVRLADIPPTPLATRSVSPDFHRQGPGAGRRVDHSDRGFGPTPSDKASDETSRSTGDILRQFDGIDSSQTSLFPPDTNLAVGPQYVVEVANSGFAVYSKTGDATRAFRSFNSFLSDSFPPGWGGYTFDPRIVFDPTYQKFVMLILGKDEDQLASGYWLAVSADADPRGDWCIRARDTSDDSGGAPAWLDFAGLGTDPFGVYVTGNYIYFSGNLRGGAVHTFPADVMTGCGPVGGAVIHDVRWPGGLGQAQSLQPAQAHTENAAGETFFVNTWPAFGNEVMLSRLSGNRGSHPTLTSTNIAIPAYGAILNTVDQPGSAIDIDGGKSWPLSAVYVDGRVLFSLGTSVASTPDASGWLTVELDTDSETLVWDHLYWLGEGRYLMYPALAFQGDTRNGRLAVFGSETDTETFLTPSTLYASGRVRLYDDRSNGNGGPGPLIAQGTSAYQQFDDDGRNRWGDYSGAAYDWTCGHAWGAVQSATGTQNWKTTIASIEFDSEGGCPQIYVTSPVLGQALDSGATYHIRWWSENLPTNDFIYLFYDTVDAPPVQIAGPIVIGQTGYFWDVPEVPGDDIRIIVGSYNGSAYTALHYSDPFVITDTIAPMPDPLAWLNAPVAAGSDAIAMSTLATDGSGDDVQYLFEFIDSPDGGSGGSSRSWLAASIYQNDGLQPNYEYCYRAMARDVSGNTTGATATECVHTLADSPTVGGFQDITSTSITVLANTNGNSDDTTYQFENLVAGERSDWLDEPVWSNGSLLPDRSYAYRVRARNSDQIPSAWTLLGAVTTSNDDADGDGVLAAMDNCLTVANPNQRDTDGDSIGNLCDFDLSQDCTVNVIDLGVLKARYFSNDEDADFNGDTVVNVIDLGLMRTAFFGTPGPSGLPNACQP